MVPEWRGVNSPGPGAGGRPAPPIVALEPSALLPHTIGAKGGPMAHGDKKVETLIPRRPGYFAARRVLERLHRIDLDDLRRAGKRASEYRGPKDNIVRPDFARTRTGRRVFKARLRDRVGPWLS